MYYAVISFGMWVLASLSSGNNGVSMRYYDEPHHMLDERSFSIHIGQVRIVQLRV